MTRFLSMSIHIFGPLAGEEVVNQFIHVLGAKVDGNDGVGDVIGGDKFPARNVKSPENLISLVALGDNAKILAQLVPVKRNDVIRFDPVLDGGVVNGNGEIRQGNELRDCVHGGQNDRLLGEVKKNRVEFLS